MKKIEELQNANKRKNRFPIQEVKENKRLIKLFPGFQNHEVFMWICDRIHKKGRKTAVLVRTIKQAKIIKISEETIYIYQRLLDFNFILITCRVNRNDYRSRLSQKYLPCRYSFYRKMYYGIIQNVLRDIKMLLVSLITQKPFWKSQALPKLSYKLTWHINQ